MTPYRYSHAKVSAYSNAVAVPNYFRWITSEEEWNLAWLSFFFEQHEVPEDVRDVVIRMVQETCYMLPDGSIPSNITPGRGSIATFMWLPAQEAVEHILRCRQLKATPMYRVFGEDWLYVMTARASIAMEHPLEWRGPNLVTEMELDRISKESRHKA